MAIIRIEDTLDDPVEYSAYWHFSGVRSRTDAEKGKLGEDALEAKCKQ